MKIEGHQFSGLVRRRVIIARRSVHAESHHPLFRLNDQRRSGTWFAQGALPDLGSFPQVEFVEKRLGYKLHVGSTPRVDMDVRDGTCIVNCWGANGQVY